MFKPACKVILDYLGVPIAKLNESVHTIRSIDILWKGWLYRAKEIHCYIHFHSLVANVLNQPALLDSRCELASIARCSAKELPALWAGIDRYPAHCRVCMY